MMHFDQAIATATEAYAYRSTPQRRRPAARRSLSRSAYNDLRSSLITAARTVNAEYVLLANLEGTLIADWSRVGGFDSTEMTTFVATRLQLSSRLGHYFDDAATGAMLTHECDGRVMLIAAGFTEIALMMILPDSQKLGLARVLLKRTLATICTILERKERFPVEDPVLIPWEQLESRVAEPG